METKNNRIVIHRHTREEWKLLTYIDGKKYNFTKNYYISNYGNIKNDKFIMKPALRGKYYRINLRFYDENNHSQNKSFSIHRLVCEYFCDRNINNLPTVNHIDGCTTNNIFTNLEWASYKDQAIHAYKLGLSIITKGEVSHLSVITNEMAKQICEYLQNGLNVTEIRNKMNLDTSYTEIISRIRKRKTWKWLSKDYTFSTKPFPKEYLPYDVINDICFMISENKSYNAIYNKYKQYFDLYTNPKSKYRDIKNKRAYKTVSDKYF